LFITGRNFVYLNTTNTYSNFYVSIGLTSTDCAGTTASKKLLLQWRSFPLCQDVNPGVPCDWRTLKEFYPADYTTFMSENILNDQGGNFNLPTASHVQLKLLGKGMKSAGWSIADLAVMAP